MSPFDPLFRRWLLLLLKIIRNTEHLEHLLEANKEWLPAPGAADARCRSEPPPPPPQPTIVAALRNGKAEMMWVGAFVAAALAEIAGCFAFWAWLRLALEAHLVPEIETMADFELLKERVRTRLSASFSIEHATLEPCLANPHRSDDCASPDQ